jgi:beta-glucosidase
VLAGGIPVLAGEQPSVAAPTDATCSWVTSINQSPDQRADEVVEQMSLTQKIGMLHQFLSDAVGSFGAAGYVPGIPALCIPPLVLNDAGTGLADEQTDVTSYPAGIAQAASWDPSLEERLGASLGAEAHAKGVDVLLGPDLNITRTPLGGRTSEQLGEDPYLSGQMGVGFIRGIQSQHVIATAKHFDGNDQEVNRATINELISQRALHEIYQPGFDAAVNQGDVGAVMCSYNEVNGAHACQNPDLLSTDLRDQEGFKGFVMSDWGADHSTVASALAGLDLEMDIAQVPDALEPAAGDNAEYEDYYGAPLEKAVEDGQVPMSVLNSMVHAILRSMFAIGVFNDPPAAEPASYAAAEDTPANQAVALSSAEAGTVLLKDADSVLPLTGSNQRIALIGLDAGVGAELADQAGGSVRVLQPDVVTPLAALTERAARDGDTVIYNDGDSIPAAAAVAATANVAIVYAGYAESEGADLTSLGYDNGICDLTCVTEPANSNALIAAVAAANPHTVVVLNTGGPALMPWLSQVQGVLEAWYPGEEDGAAASAILFGDVDPSAKLPVTFPASLAQTPTQTAQQYPGVNGTMTYSEGLLVGYRWYQAEHLTPLFPFGYGLSYTTFSFSNLVVRTKGLFEVASFTVRNTGDRTGAEVAQLYVGDPPSVGEPPEQLKGFDKVSLAPGGSTQVTLNLNPYAFAYWNTQDAAWKVAPGRYTLAVGDSSNDLPLQTTIAIP